jgi:hypothetical protein
MQQQGAKTQYDTCAQHARPGRILAKYANVFPVERKTTFQRQLSSGPGIWIKLFGRNGNNQLLATFGTPALDNIRATIAAHSFPEAMGALATNSTRLICSLHDLVLLLLLSIHKALCT